MLEMKIIYNSHNSVLLPFWGKFSKCRYFRVAVTFGGGGALLSGFNRRAKY